MPKKQKQVKYRHSVSAHKTKQKPLSPEFSLKTRLALISLGSLIVAVWTVLRQITNGVNFDIVGQIGLTSQWASGFFGGSKVGATNYLLKMPLYFLVNHISFLTQMHKLLLLSLILNLATFILLFVILEKILKLYNLGNHALLYAAMLWLATISGSVFWLEYANSRNIETVGGLLLILLALKFISKQNALTLVLFIIAGSITFFADPLQLYVVGVGISVFASVYFLLFRSKQNFLIAGAILSATTLSYAFSQALTWLTKIYLHVTFLAAPHSTVADFNLSYCVRTLRRLGTNTLKIFGADFFKQPPSFNTIREVLNAAVMLAIFALAVKLIVQKRLHKAQAMIMVIIIVNFLVYAVSGEVLQWETSRYLVMVPLLTILFVALSSDFGGKYIKFIYVWLLITSVSTLLLIGALATNWPKRYSKDAHIDSSISFLQANHFKYALSGRGEGITISYFSKGKNLVLPMACTADHRLRPTNLFYDDAVFKSLYTYTQDVPIILPAGNIRFGLNNCKSKDVLKQFGPAKRQLEVPGVGTALIYSSQSLNFFYIDKLVGHPRPIARSETLQPTSNLKKLGDCLQGTIDVVVAHPDDDLLFMNPSLQRATKTKCVRTMYVTAADDGRPQQYWEGREQGVEAAYAKMLSTNNVWTDETITIHGQTVKSRILVGHPNIGLIFLRLPDGNVHGNGFASTGHADLEKLAAHKILSLKAVDNTATYSYSQLVDLVGEILTTDNPSVIYTHLSSGIMSDGDHSDHKAVGALTFQTLNIIKLPAQLVMYVGYPSNYLPPNLLPQTAKEKRSIFYIYANHDSAICKLAKACTIEQTYGRYFSRSYKIDLPKQSFASKKPYSPYDLPKSPVLNILTGSGNQL